MGYTLCVLGCGTMGIAILSGVLDSLHHPTSRSHNKWESHTPGTLTPWGEHSDQGHEPSKFIACVARQESATKLRATFAGMTSHSNFEIVLAEQNQPSVKKADVVLLCCKPQLARAILSEPGMKEALAGKLLISILAGVTISQLRDLVDPTTIVIRAMPNTPCKIREGMTVISTLPSTTSDEKVEGTIELNKQIIIRIFSSIGRCRFLDEKHFDACTALSGSGPAFACVFLEAMADGGVMMGLPRAEALELAAQTLQGAARMVLHGGNHPAQLKDSVTTPGGCTIAGLLTLEDGRVRSTIARTIQVATEHASHLGQPAPSSK